jgi:anti-sigma factor RsiW
MHPRSATLIAFCDAEGGASRSRRIAKHLAKCDKCRKQTQRIRAEKNMLSAGDGRQAMDTGQGLDRVLSAMAAWQGDRATMAASELTNRLRWQIQTYVGFPAARGMERPGIRAEELLAKASEMLEVFLGPSAAEAVKDDALRELDWTTTAGERCR